ncbi:aspartate/glutamate racemase family protein [Telmatospirillum sp.]|uniref:aspartate/glutamate racemase family protein n=1 Tax=Telmatospirillum sp. TaxID=2079197 RepID=UPI00283FE080|nr:aspartate/glutamate racemase family protein [Telmatospirillum sp.]MDR3437237.1 aspartate/glutamate racemase family protein [Telmatospirillum sp.]
MKTSQCPKRILLINPNSSLATTGMMVDIATGTAGIGFEVVGATATRSPAMITHPQALTASAAEVIEIARANAREHDGIIVAAFGDPGLTEIQAAIRIPAAGIAEAAMLEAAEDGRKFGIATTTPDLMAAIRVKVASLGLLDKFAGIRVTSDDPNDLVAHPERLQSALAKIIRDCINLDGAEAVIIGGGPLGQAALHLQPMFSTPIVAPIPAAVRRIIKLINRG